MSRTFRKNRKTGEPENDTYNRRTHISSGCRHHGACSWCEGNRKHNSKRKEDAAYYEMNNP